MIQEIRDKAKWNEFLLAQPTQAGIFLQSWGWGEFQKAVGRKVWRLGVRDPSGPEALKGRRQVSGASFAQAIEMPLPFGKKYWFIPRGTLIPGLEEEARKHGVIFLRIEPTQSLTPDTWNLKPTRSVSPSQTLIVDVGKPEEELLAGMHEKTRYNIRLALRRGVEIRNLKLDIRSEFEAFWKLLRETAKRDRFRTHERGYYETMLRMLGITPLLNPPPLVGGGKVGGAMRVRLHMAYHSATPLAAAIVAYFGDTATYLHGASSYEHRALMGPYALHWEIVRDAKARGYKFYDFWGINVADGRQTTDDSSSRKPFAVRRKHDWSGMTRFKMGFGGTVVDYPGAFDLPISKFWYTLYRFGRKMLP